MKTAKGVKNIQSLIAQGRKSINIGAGTQMCVYPSPRFKRGEFCLEVRKAAAKK